MKLALIGIDEATLALAAAAEDSATHRIVLVCDVEPADWQLLQQQLGHAPPRTGWEDLLHAAPVDAAIVARATDQEVRAEQLRKLTQAGVPLLVSHPAVDSMLVYYELDMIRRESHAVLLPDMPWRLHPGVRQLAAIVGQGAASPIGAAEQALFERWLLARDQAAVLRQFACDVDLIRSTCGDVTRLAALGAPDQPETYANLGVQMTIAEGPALRWSVGPVDDEAGARLTVIGTRGKAILHMSAVSPSPLMGEGRGEGRREGWRLELRSEGALEEMKSFADWNGPVEMLATLQAAIEGEHDERAWLDAARSVELAEAVERSLKRGRAVELHNEDFTDIGTFKGTMTSVGCGLLFGMLFLLGGLALVSHILRKAGAVRLADALKPWPYWLAGVLVLFLAIQFLLKVAAPARSREESDRDDATNAGGKTG